MKAKRRVFDPDAAAQPGSGIFGLPHAPEEARVVLVPVPFEATTSYGGGASKGPAAILAASRQVDLFDIDLGRPYEAGIALLPEDLGIRRWNREAKVLARRVIEAGGTGDGGATLTRAAARVDRYCELMNERVQELTETWLARGKVVGVVGGDHSAPFGAIAAYAKRHPGLGILHIDAHADLREAYEGFTWSHASIMHNVTARLPGVGRLVQVGIRDLCNEEYLKIRGSKERIRTYFDSEIRDEVFAGTPFERIARQIVADLPGEVYVSFDIDGLDPVLCPHTGTPVPGGLSFHEAVHILATLADSGRRIVGFDLNEVAPGAGGDEWDGNVGARLLYKMIGFCLLAVGQERASSGKRRGGSPPRGRAGRRR